MFSNDSCNVIVQPQEYFIIFIYRVSYCFFDTIYNAESLLKIALTALMFKSLLDTYHLLRILGKN